MIKRRTLLSSISCLPFLSVPSVFAEENEWKETVDVLVFGGGMGGLTAAISAKQSGMKKSFFLKKPLS